MNIYNSSENILNEKFYEIDNIYNKDKKFYIGTYIKDDLFFINLKVFIKENEFILKSTFDEFKSNNEFFISKENLNEINESFNKLIIDSKNPPKIDENKNEYKLNLFPKNNKNITFSFKKEKEITNNFLNILNEIEQDLSLIDKNNKEISNDKSKIIQLVKEKEELIIQNNKLKNIFHQIEKEYNNQNINKKFNLDKIKIEYENLLNKIDNNNCSNLKNSLNSINSKNNTIKKNINISLKNQILTDELKNYFINILIKKFENFQYKNIFMLLYKATRDGCLAKDFHNKVDGNGPLFIIIESTQNQIFGGFTSMAWSSKNDYIEDSNAFLFCNKKIYEIKNKMFACNHDEKYGPYFGEKALVIFDDCLNNIKNFTDSEDESFNFKKNKNLLNEEKNSYFQVKDYEVYKYY